MIEAELADGRVLEFPDGTDPNVIQSTVKKMIGSQERPSPSLGDRVNALQGGLYRGAAGLAGLPMDTVENVYNLAKAGVGTVATAAGRPDLAPNLTRGTPLGSEWLANQMQNIGINTQNPRPDDTASRMLYTGGVIGGGSMLPGAAVKPTIAAGGAGAVAGEISDNPLAPAIGAMVPGAVGQAAAVAKNAMAARAAPTVETFKQAGTMPSVGQAVDNVFLHGMENLASKFPGGAGVMQKFIEGQQSRMGAQARTGTPTEAAGRAIEKGVGGFLERTNATWRQLDSAVAAKIPPTVRVSPANTLQAIDDLTRPVQGAENLTGGMVHPEIAKIRANLGKDLEANNGAIPYEALRRVRSDLGQMMDQTLVSGIPQGQIKKLYGALSKDMEATANAAGAGKEFARQNNFYRARMDRVESVLERVIGKGKQPEDIFKTFYPTDPDQANKVRAVMRSLAPSERQVVSEAVANRLGRARPGSQDADSTVFSSETFLTNWNKLSPGAKAQLFPDPPLRENMDKIARAASQIRTGKGVYANPSGTAGSFAAYAVYMGPIAALGGAIGNFPGALGASVASAATANIGAKMLTNPKVVDWLAKPVNPQRPGEAAAHLARLAVIYNQSDEETKKELGAYMQSVGQ
jgi:hypothetical protein